MLGERLAFLRRRENISQKELGEKLNISHYTISSYEKGRSEPNDEIKVRIASYFNVSMDYLVGLVDQPYPFDRDKGVLYFPQRLPAAFQDFVRDFLNYWEEQDKKAMQARKKTEQAQQQ